MKPRTGNDRERALTLVEVLVIIVVLFVLVGMLLPVVNRPPGVKATRIKCVNNLKNVGLAFRIFATDNNDRFPMQLGIAGGRHQRVDNKRRDALGNVRGVVKRTEHTIHSSVPV